MFDNFPVIMIAGGVYNDWGNASSSVELYNPKTNSSCFITPLPANRSSSVASGLKVCGGSFNSSCVEFQGGTWSTSNQLLHPRNGSSGWNSSEGLVLLGGFSKPNTTEILKDYFSENNFNLTNPRV